MCPFPSILLTFYAFLVPVPSSIRPLTCLPSDSIPVASFHPQRSSYEMVLNVDVLCSCKMFRIVSKGDSALIVAVDDILVANVVAYFLEEAMEPDELLEG